MNKGQKTEKDMMTLMNNHDLQLDMAMHIANLRETVVRERRAINGDNNMGDFIGVYDIAKKPRASSLPCRIILKNMSDDEYYRGYILDKTKNKIISELNSKRSELKKKLKKKPGDTRIKNEIKKTRVPIFNSIARTLMAAKKLSGSRSKTSMAKTINNFNSRPRQKPVTIANDIYSMMNADLINNSPAYDRGVNSNGTSFSVNNTNIAVAYTGTDIKSKSGRIIFGCFREFKRRRADNRGAIPTQYNKIAIIDCAGSIRQLKRIMNTILKLSEKNYHGNIYIPTDLAHRFRCDFEMEDTGIKLIDSYTRSPKGTDLNGDIKKLEYPHIVSWVSRSGCTKLNRNYIIPKSKKITGKLKPRADVAEVIVPDPVSVGPMVANTIVKLPGLVPEFGDPGLD